MATTTIPWDDGSGDNIYFTYSSASGDQTVTVTSDAYTSSGVRTKDVIFTTVNSGEIASATLTVTQEGPPPYDSCVEYLQSSGAQYIDTGYTPNADTVFIMEASLTSSQNNITMAGLYREPNPCRRFHIGTYQSQWHFGVSSNGASNKWTNFTGGINTNKHIFEVRGTGYCAVDSSTKQISVNNNGTYDHNIFLFARSQYLIQSSAPRIGQYAKMKLYGAKIYENNVLIHDYVPCRIDQTGYLYDKVTRELLGNSGTGSFTIGSDV